METDTSKGEKVAPTNWREVVKVSGLKEGDTIALYLVGSRLYGSHHPHSDYDFLLVTPTLDTSFNYIRTESENVDVGVYHEEYWNKLLNEEHEPFVVFCNFLPKDNVWKEDKRFQLSLRYNKWQQSICHDLTKNAALARKFWNMKEIHKAKKKIAFGLRILNLGIQLLKKGTIEDFSICNELVSQVLKMEFKDWKDCDRWYKQTSEPLLAELYELVEPPKYLPPSDITQLHTPSFIKQNSISSLETRLSIKVTPSHEIENMIHLHFIKGEAPLSSRIVQECCGLSLIQDKESDDWKVVCYPYKMFFSHSDKENAASIDWNTAQVFEKYDGVLVSMFWYLGSWRVVFQSSYSFGAIQLDSSVFWRVWNQLKYELPADNTLCFMFELCCKDYRKIVMYEEDTIVLHGVRDMKTLQEIHHVPVAQKHKWKYAEPKQLQSVNLSSVLRLVDNLPLFTSEGFVIRDGTFNRIIVKGRQRSALEEIKKMIPKYVHSRHFVTFFVAELLHESMANEFSKYFPEWSSFLEDVKNTYNQFKDAVNETYASFKTSDKKQFAAKINSADVRKAVKWALYALQNNSVSSLEQLVENRFVDASMLEKWISTYYQ